MVLLRLLQKAEVINMNKISEFIQNIINIKAIYKSSHS